MARLYGYSSRALLLGTPVWAMTVGHRNQALSLETHLEFCRQGYRMVDLESQEYTLTGEKIYLLNNAVGILRDGLHSMTWGTLSDISAIKLAQEELQQLNAELESRVEQRTAELKAANRELEAFSYSVSHDLRAPLRAVTAYAHLLDSDFGAQLEPEARILLDNIQSAGVKMGELIDELLDFSRAGSRQLTIEAVEMEILVQSVIASLSQETAHRQIDWVLGALPVANADPALIQQVYANLIGNAVKYTSKLDVAHIEIGSAAQNDETIYFVRDNGAGFNMRYADQLFRAFQRLHSDEEFEGTGLGLAIVQRIVARHGGRVWAEAEVGRGATFYFTLQAA
jgi:light-regulated signal transduction histidine kinase (bacteriophytochrome)